MDDNQVVRPAEVGTVDLIRAAAGNVGTECFEIELKGLARGV